MAGGYSIGISADAKAVKQAVQAQIIAPVEDAQQALEDLGTTKGPQQLEGDLKKAGSAARDAGDDLERSMKDAQSATSKAEDELQQMRRQLGQVGRSAKDAGADGKAGMHKIQEGADEVQNELGANMSETFSSFRGDLSDIGQIGQDTLGGLAGTVAGMGPAGAAGAAGLGLVAAGVGVIQGAFEKAKEATDQAMEAAFNYANQVGDAFAAAGYQERVQEWTSSQDKWNQALDISKVSGMDVGDVIDALASGDKKLDKLWKSFEKGANQTTLSAGRAMELEGAIDGTRKGYEQGAAAAAANANALGRYADKAGKATGKTDSLGNSIKKLPDNTEVVVDAKTGKAYADLQHFEDKKKVATKDETVQVRADFSPFQEAVRRMRNTGLKPISIDVVGNVKYRTPDGKYLE